MYTTLIKAGKSIIEGRGVFADEDIAKGTIVWKFVDGHDHKITPAEYDALPQSEKERLEKVGYLSPWTNFWVYPPEDDPAQYTNHSNSNNLSAVYDPKISEEPYFIANRNIAKGEELTNNYNEFDVFIQKTQPEWVK